MSVLEKIKAAQREAGEQAVLGSLRGKGLVFEPAQKRPGILDVETGRAIVVERHDIAPSNGFRNVWIIDAT